MVWPLWLLVWPIRFMVWHLRLDWPLRLLVWQIWFMVRALWLMVWPLRFMVWRLHILGWPLWLLVWHRTLVWLTVGRYHLRRFLRRWQFPQRRFHHRNNIQLPARTIKVPSGLSATEGVPDKNKLRGNHSLTMVATIFLTLHLKGFPFYGLGERAPLCSSASSFCKSSRAPSFTKITRARARRVKTS